MKSLLDRVQWACDRVFEYIPQRLGKEADLDSVRLVAHRGAWKETGHLENTLSAFESCLNAGVAGIEFDIRWSRDHEAVVMHDPQTGRVHSGPPLEIAKNTLAEIRETLPAVPTLKEVVARFDRRTQYVETPHPGGLFCSFTDENRTIDTPCREFEVITATRVSELAAVP